MSIATETVVADSSTFSWTIRQTDGKEKRGTSTHSSREGLIRKLAADPNTQSVLKVQSNRPSATKSSKAPKNVAVVAAARQLELCLGVGLDPLEAINVLRDGGDIEDPILSKALAEVSLDMSQGVTMSHAMGKHKYVFPELMTATLRAGEAGGFVAKAISQVADDLEAEDDQRQKVKKAMTYPVVVFVVSTLIFIFLMGYVVPQFGSLYTSMSNGKAQLPMLTRVVMGISNQMIWLVPTMMCIAIAVIIWYKRNAQEEKVREIVDPLKMRLPVFGQLYRKVALTKFCRIYSALLDNGMHPVDALFITSTSVGNISMERAILSAREGLRRGESMVEPLANEPLFPKLLLTFITIGEKTGEQSKALSAIGRLYNRDVDTLTNNMAALIEPIFTMVLAVMVGTVALAIYMPYFSIGDLMGPESMTG
jgi:type IV pilus assembly protein PilC